MIHLDDMFDPSQFKVTVGPVLTEIKEPIDFHSTEIDTTDIPVLPLRGVVLFPYITAPLPIGRESSLKLVKDAAKSHKPIFVVTQKNPEVEEPGSKDLNKVGVVCTVMKVLDLPDGTTTAILLCGIRGVLNKILKRKPYLRGSVLIEAESEPEATDPEMYALMSSVEESYSKILNVMGEHETRELRFAISQFDSSVKTLNFICSNSPLEWAEKQALLDMNDLKKRAYSLVHYLNLAFQLIEIKADIQTKTHEDLSQQQREHFLHQQIRTIQDELGGTIEDNEIKELRARAEKKNWGDDVKKHFEKEIQKLERYNSANPEYSVQYSYLDTLLNLPWNNYSESDFTLQNVEDVMNRDHYGLEEVKERIVEQMAVMKLRKDMKAPILCLYGPPGVGKTSLGKSVADALGREYVRVSLGGLHDEAEIRGHRRTYIGAMPGRIMSALAKCGTSNPVFVLDEIDKIGQDFKGDPSTALLEVLDPEQNNKFHDNYIDVDYDLSKVLFIATANSLSTISRPLLDRMELIDISGYITDEKVEIALRHLIARNLEEHGFASDEITFDRDAIVKIIDNYTRESGVRQLDKKIAKVIRKIARMKASEKEYPKIVTVDVVKELLGAEEVTPDVYENNDVIGVVTGLAWTQVGGEILFIESSLSPGKGDKLTLTGNLGDVMKESAVIAMQYLKAHADMLGINRDSFDKQDVHIHVPEGAIPKDGPSAGVTMITSLASSFTGRKVRPRLAMTGEITLRGKVLPVGGIREKIIAAKRAGITDIILCDRNKKDIDEIPEKYIAGLSFHYVTTIDEVLKMALL
jgi:ATP-dependent Lon protease